MITMTCLMGVVVLLSLLLLCPAAAAAAIGAMELMVIAHSATPHSSLEVRRYLDCMIHPFSMKFHSTQAVTGECARPVTVSADQPLFCWSLSPRYPKSNRSNRSPMAGMFRGT